MLFPFAMEAFALAAYFAAYAAVTLPVMNDWVKLVVTGSVLFTEALPVTF